MAIAFWQGGLAWQGGIPVGFFVVFIAAKIMKKPFWESAGCIAPGFALTHAITRIGCLLRGCCHGSPTDLPWGIYSKELCTKVHPTQIYSMIAEIITFIILQKFWKKKEYRKYLLPGYGALFSFQRFFQEFFRGVPPGPEIISGLRVYQVVCILLFSFSICIIFILRNKKSGFRLSAAVAILLTILFIVFHPVHDDYVSKSINEGDIYLVITRSMFQEELTSWKEFREKQGYQVIIKSWKNSPSSAEIIKWINELPENQKKKLSYILIVGDAPALEEGNPGWSIPTVNLSPKNIKNAPEIISDSLYGDIDIDGSPDIPTGRLPVRNLTHLRIITGKILDFEKIEITPKWFRTIVWSGAKGYHPEMYRITKEMAIRNIPPWLDSYIISGNINSSFSGYPPDQPLYFLNEIRDAAFLSLIISHGSYRSVTPATFNEKDIFLSNESVEDMTFTKTGGPLIMLGCSSGKFNTDESEDSSLAETFLRNPGGPSSVISSSALTDPLTNYMLSREMLYGMKKHPGSIGEFFLGLQKRIYRRGGRSMAEIAQEDLFASNLVKATPENEKKNLFIPGIVKRQILQYNLLGDPASPLYRPSPLKVDVEEKSNKILNFSGRIPEGSEKLVIDMILVSQKKDEMKPFPGKKKRIERFERVNSNPVRLLEKHVSGKEWSASINLPDNFTKEQDRIRIFLTGKNSAYYHIYPEPEKFQ
jgi:peptidase C25-like protein/prolipoprotein diacylglyceryl transferase